MIKRLSYSDKKFIEKEVAKGETSKSIASKLGCSIWTVKKWRSRVKKKELSSTMGRPRKVPGSSFGGFLLKLIKLTREGHSRWGAKTIWSKLLKYIPKDCCPSVDTIARYLRFQKLTRPYLKQRPLPHSVPTVGKKPHDCWQIDDKGNDLYPDVGYICLVSIKDSFTRVYVHAEPLFLKSNRSHPKTVDYLRALRYSFEHYGLPNKIQSDHGSLFYHNKSNSPYPTPLHLWLLGLGVELIWSRIHRPTDQAFVERMHETLKNRMVRTVPYRSQEEFRRILANEIHELNTTFPCSTLGNQPPLKRFPNALSKIRNYTYEQEKELFDKQRILRYLAGKEWVRRVSKDKSIAIGGQIYYINPATPQTEIRISVCVEKGTFCFYYFKELLAESAIKGIDYKDFL